MESIVHGICRLTMISVRAAPSDRSEMVTQLLFGEYYTVLEEMKEGGWLRIRIEWDQYEGWIDQKQHTPISAEYFQHLNHTEFKIATDITTDILYKKQRLHIVIGSILPITSNELFEISGQFAFNGASKNMGEKQEFDYLKQTAQKFMKAPYLWGGRSPFGIDCSGLTQQLFKICGYKLKRDARQQFLQGNPVENIGEAKPGDLAFFSNDDGQIVHVGILMEDQDFIHASGYVRKDKLDNKGIFNEELTTYTHQLAGLRRILKP